MKSKLPKPKVGQLLLAEPFNPEPYFKRSAILVAQHDKTGSVGFVVNKPTSLLIHDALDDFPAIDCPVYWGGSNNVESVYYVHTLGKKLEGSVAIGNGIWWGGKYGVLKLLIESKEVKPHEIKFFAGYSAWPNESLHKEISSNNWWVSEANVNNLFLANPDHLWGEELKKLGHVYGIMNDFPEDPGIN